MTEQENKKKSFKDTLNLPDTDFPIRADYTNDDIRLINRWNEENLYKKAFYCNNGKEKFILHDGPPYANGHTHIGHAYNKTLKDIVCKSQRMLGKHVPVTPGWDCHGLPIEYAVKKENSDLTGAELKKACRDYANKWITVQKEEFKRLGVLMDWDKPYLTMSAEYEASILNAFGIFVEKGYIERKNKTVPWCPTCETVLASAEIEYHDRKDPSVYVLFTLTDETRSQLVPQLTNKPVSLLVWTTTPWTLPLNRAIILKPNTEYAILDAGEEYIVVGAFLVEAITALLSLENSSIIATFNSDFMAKKQGTVIHPLDSTCHVPVLLDDSVLTNDGTACVHSAPGAGPIDYEVGIKNNLEIYSPIDSKGRYTAAIAPTELIGLSVADGQGWVIKKLLENNKLLFKTSIKHSYPHCWRCRGGLIFRATKQWFCDLSHNSLKEKAVAAIQKINMIPEGSHNRFEATLEGRLEWCLSRQREWGVPIPALLCLDCSHPYTNKDFIDMIASGVAKEGIEYWDSVSLESLLPKNISCSQCESKNFKKETDIIDVWFESGVSHYAVLSKNSDLSYPADIYLEGKDQHRAWFQSSLLTSMIIEQTPCTKAIVTHGFTVDKNGRKMSKSLGNVVSPQEMINQLGTDGVRLWVSSIDNTGDAVVSDVLLKNVQEVLRKIRNTCRFLLSNINDFDIIHDAVSIEEMKIIDKYALQELFELHQDIIHGYKTYNFTKIFHALGTYCSVNLSSFYLDIIKDRLYTQQPNGKERRSAQTVCATILDTLTKLMAPILSFTAEQLSDHYQKNKTESIHLQLFPQLTSVWQELIKRNSANKTMQHYESVNEQTSRSLSEISLLRAYEQQWQDIKNIRSALLKAIEVQREKQLIKHSLEAHVVMHIDSSAHYAGTIAQFFTMLNENGENAHEFFKEFLIVSQVTIAQSNDALSATGLSGLTASVNHAEGKKCPRCWQWSITNHVDDLCSRCENVIG